MAYRKLDHIDEKIVKATISLAGAPHAKKGVSTKDIAERCHISEYVIFKHFGNKQNLMIAADKMVMNALSQGAIALEKEHLDFFAFFNRYLDFLLSHKGLTFFALNFGHGIPHAADTSAWGENEYETFLKENAAIFFSPLQPGEEDSQALIWDYFMRNCLYFSSFILYGYGSDNSNTRELMFSLIGKGIHSFTKGEQV